MALGRCNQRSCAPQIRQIQVFAFRLLFLDLDGVLHVSEHIQFRGNTENKSFLQRGAPGVHMSINQSRQERVARTINYPYSGRRLDLCAHGLDMPALDPNIALLNHARAIKDSSVANDEFIVFGPWRLRVCCRNIDEKENEDSSDSGKASFHWLNLRESSASIMARDQRVQVK